MQTEINDHKSEMSALKMKCIFLQKQLIKRLAMKSRMTYFRWVHLKRFIYHDVEKDSCQKTISNEIPTWFNSIVHYIIKLVHIIYGNEFRLQG